MARSLAMIPYAPERSPSPPPQNKIMLKVKHQVGEEDVFRIGYSTRLKKLMDACYAKRNIEKGTVRFIFSNKQLKPRHTAAPLMMENGDVIDVVADQVGG